MASKMTGWTDVVDMHAHAYEMDEYGNGATKGQIGQGDMAPHTHQIVAKKIQPSGTDNHTHKLARGKPGSIASE